METLSYVPDNAVRVKVTNDCQWGCTFCHNEGTETPDNQRYRVSVFLDEAQALPAVEEFPYTPETMGKLTALRDAGIDEIHLTGGEPTLHPHLPEIVRDLKADGFTVKMTTNGQGRPEMLERLAEAGLDSITFSVLSMDQPDFTAVQGNKSAMWANLMLNREKANILKAKKLGLNIKLNTVVLGPDDHPRVDKIREFAEENGLTLVLLNSLGDGETAQEAVFDYADKHGTQTGDKRYTNNGKGSRIYEGNGIRMDAKYVIPYHPDVVCSDCEHRNQDTCVEKFYGIRMEFRGGEPYVRLCVQKTTPQTVMPLQEFLDKGIAQQL